MADFNEAHAKTAQNEGGYANNPADTGGETIYGVARNHWPKWEGWMYLDRITSGMVKQPPYGSVEYRTWVKFLNGQCAQSPQLQSAVSNFYRRNFWDANRYGEITDQRIATWLYDRAVNCGSGAANKMVQRAIGTNPDGGIGPITLKAINDADPDNLLPRLVEEAKDYYTAIVERNPSQKQFLAGWLKRCEVA